MAKKLLTAAIIGQDGRTAAIERALRASPLVGSVSRLHDWKSEGPEAAIRKTLERAKEARPDFVVVGPEDPLANGVVDRLQDDLKIPCIGPTRELAQLEASKSFARKLLAEYKIPGNPEFQIFNGLRGIQDYLGQLRRRGGYVIKPDGLTGGKGVKISDAQLFSEDEALAYCEAILGKNQPVVVEEKLDGEEFSLMSLCDGYHVAHMVVVQDHKRVGEGDEGPNTGGMGSYSCQDHQLPFLASKDLSDAKKINERVAEAIRNKTGKPYRGVLYGGFMLAPNGLRLLEYNARFGDPETLNVLSILKTDFAILCQAMVNEELDKVSLEFERLATVCKYLVPEGYPDAPKKGAQINLDDVPPDEPLKLQSYRAALDENNRLTGSRAIAFVGIGKNLQEAEAIAEKAANSVRGPVFHRKDIGTDELIQRRIAHVKSFSTASPTR
ncbi:MAG: phosphoribosylamine--glycine ligase, partial [Limisphaerales bacterium]